MESDPRELTAGSRSCQTIHQSAAPVPFITAPSRRLSDQYRLRKCIPCFSAWTLRMVIEQFSFLGAGSMRSCRIDRARRGIQPAKRRRLADSGSAAREWVAAGEGRQLLEEAFGFTNPVVDREGLTNETC